MKHLIWLTAGLALFSGMAMTRQSPPPAQDPSPPRERTLAFPEPLALTFDRTLGSAVRNLEDPASLDDQRFGLSRIPVFKVGNHNVPVYGATLWLYGNKTAKFDPANWTSQTIGYSAAAPPDDDEKRAYDRRATEAIGYFNAGWRQPIRWTDPDGYFEARQVRLSDAECITCHRDNKEGGIVGVVMLGMTREAGQRVINAAATGP